MKTLMPFGLAVLLIASGAFQNRPHCTPAVAQSTHYKTTTSQ